MFLFLHGLALMFGFLMGLSDGSGISIHTAGGGISAPMDGGGGNMPGDGSGGGGGGH
ncbi:MAG: hypothetical protein WB609_10920 [Candidatus Cybelea sp.]